MRVKSGTKLSLIFVDVEKRLLVMFKTFVQLAFFFDDVVDMPINFPQVLRTWSRINFLVLLVVSYFCVI